MCRRILCSPGTNSISRLLSAIQFENIPKNQEASMRAAKIVLAGLTAPILIASAAFAQQSMTGMITQIDRLNGTIAIQQTQSGTVGANTGAQNFKIQDSKLLEDFHAGDRVTYVTTDGDGAKTITKLQKQ
jgi:Cu/Ag efflux protein CusF